MSDDITNDEVLTEPVKEQTVEAPEKFDGLSNRDALKRSLEIHRDGKEPEEKPQAPTKTEVAQAVEAEIDPPAEFSAAGKNAWKNKDIAGIQKEYRRIHDLRTAEITRAQNAERQAREEGKTYRELAKMAAPYIEARGADGVTPEKAIMEALALINEFKKGDPATVKAELKKIGIDLDKAPSAVASVPDEKFQALQSTVEELKREKEEAKFQQTVSTFETIWRDLTSLKTRTGELVFPDLLDNSEAGMRFASELGSLTQDARFQSGVLRRFPNADLKTLVQEAYKYLGGKVSGEAVTVSTQANQQHVARSRRAAAATPGRTAPRVNDSNLVGKLSNRAALIKAIELARER